MFDIGFPELVLVSIVALLVIGPDKLPETVRTVALWVGRIKRGFANIKQEIENEIGADEIRRQLHNESIMQQLNETRDEVNRVMNDAGSTIKELKDSAEITGRAPLMPENKEGATTETPVDAEAADEETPAPLTQANESNDEPQDTEDDGRKQSESGG